MITDPRLLLPKAHRFPDVVADKRRRIHDRHVAPLNRLVEEINAGRGAHLAPWFDPDGGGTSARVLFLLENPGRRATAIGGSGFISADNKDDTAANFFRMRDQAGLPRPAGGLERRALVPARRRTHRERHAAGPAPARCPGSFASSGCCPSCGS